MRTLLAIAALVVGLISASNAMACGSAGRSGRFTSVKSYASAKMAATHTAAQAMTAALKSGNPGGAVIHASDLNAKLIGSSKGGLSDRYQLTTKRSAPVQGSVDVSVRETASRSWIGYTGARPSFN
jgi:hypothetical protein